MQVSQLFHSASSETKMGVVNEWTRWAWLMTSLDSLRVRILSEQLGNGDWGMGNGTGEFGLGNGDWGMGIGD